MQQKKEKNDGLLIFTLYFLAFVVLALLMYLPNKNRDDIANKMFFQLFALVLLLVSLYLYSYFSGKGTELTSNKVTAMLATMVLSYGLLVCFSYWNEYGYFLAPFSFAATVIAMTVSARRGFFANFVVIILYFMQAVNFGENYTISVSMFYLLLGGTVESVYAAFIFSKHTTRLQYLFTGFKLGFISAVCCVTSALLFEVDIAIKQLAVYALLAWASGIAGVMLMFVVVPLFERLFNVVSVFRFSEIANSDNELMRKLYEKAPGTYNHSLSVAIYAEACAVAIGESAILARAAAYYHDIGKLKNPEFFAENLQNGVNPHDNMTPENSVSMIKSHTEYGLAMAKEYKLPQEIQNAIVEHHGTLPIRYFYQKAQKYTDGELSQEQYCYDGPKPTNKISAILMICDAGEAALRAQGDKTRAEEIIDEIVKERLDAEQFSNCDITLKEIDVIKSTIITTFSGIRHKRVKYPKLKLKGKQE